MNKLNNFNIYRDDVVGFKVLDVDLYYKDLEISNIQYILNKKILNYDLNNDIKDEGLVGEIHIPPDNINFNTVYLSLY